MSRIRSRQLESESVPTRVLRKDAATSDKIGTYAVRSGKEHWPGSRQVRAGDLSAGAVTVIQEQGGNAARPATILLQGDAVAVESGTEAVVTFATAVRRQLVGWDVATSPDGVTWPWSGTVMLWIAGAWDDIAPDGAYIEVLLDGVVVWRAWAVPLAEALVLTLETSAHDVLDDGTAGSDDPVEFGTAVRDQGIEATVPLSEVTWPVGGTVMVQVAGEWDDYDGGGVVEVLLDDVVVWPSDWLGDASAPDSVIASIWNADGAGSVAGVGERLVQDGSSPPVDLTLEDETDYLYEDV